MASYTYTAQDNYLQRLDYGNGDGVQYSYDDMGRVLSETYEDGEKITYQYDNDGALATVTDTSGNKTTYYYDFTNRLMKYVESGNDHNHTVSYEYDDINNLTKLVQTIQGTQTTTSYTYDLDNRVAKITTDGASRSYTYSALNRLTSRVTSHGTSPVLTETLNYRYLTGNTSTHQIDSFHSDSVGNHDVTYSYTYDGNGNITKITSGGTETSYVYDSANQLIRENNQAAGKTWVWTYDDAGNILTRREYAYTTAASPTNPTDTVTYGYDGTWGDLLTSYDGQVISHDNIGNPLSDGKWTYEWEHGRQLASMSNGSATWSYEYDANGMRTNRTNGSSTYEYFYTGDKLTYMTLNGVEVWFYYDASGTPYALKFLDEYFYYATNAQGDVTAILNSSGNEVGTYAYDAWGNPTTAIAYHVVAVINPLRYRSYVYDNETELYYLQSRYYNPEVGRFLNSDIYAATGQGLLGNNMFAYCLNNPVLYVDETGQVAVLFTEALADGLLSGLVSAVSTLVVTGSMEEALEAFIYGAGEGFICSLFEVSTIKLAIFHATQTTIESYFDGASLEMSIVAGVVVGISDISRIPVDDKLVSIVCDLTFGLGESLCTTAIVECINKNGPYNRFAYEEYILPENRYFGVGGGGGGVRPICHIAL